MADACSFDVRTKPRKEFASPPSCVSVLWLIPLMAVAVLLWSGSKMKSNAFSEAIVSRW